MFPNVICSSLKLNAIWARRNIFDVRAKRVTNDDWRVTRRVAYKVTSVAPTLVSQIILNSEDREIKLRWRDDLLI